MTARRLCIALPILLCAAPAQSAPENPPAPQLTRQDLSDIATALSVVGSHCNGDQVAACQAGANSKLIFAKLQAIYAQQEKPKKP